MKQSCLSPLLFSDAPKTTIFYNEECGKHCPERILSVLGMPLKMVTVCMSASHRPRKFLWKDYEDSSRRIVLKLC